MNECEYFDDGYCRHYHCECFEPSLILQCPLWQDTMAAIEDEWIEMEMEEGDEE